MSRLFPALLMALIALLSTQPLLADSTFATPPKDPVILSISGNLTCCPQGTAYFDLARLDAMPQTEVSTTTPWTEGTNTYSGVRISELLKAVGAQGSTISATALNDYTIAFKAAAALEYPVILATRSNGQLMRVRDKGPLWIIYPLSEYPQLRKEEFHQTMVWQLKALTISE